MPTNCLSVFDHFVNLALKGLSLKSSKKSFELWCLQYVILMFFWGNHEKWHLKNVKTNLWKIAKTYSSNFCFVEAFWPVCWDYVCRDMVWWLKIDINTNRFYISKTSHCYVHHIDHSLKMPSSFLLILFYTPLEDVKNQWFSDVSGSIKRNQWYETTQCMMESFLYFGECAFLIAFILQNTLTLEKAYHGSLGHFLFKNLQLKNER